MQRVIISAALLMLCSLCLPSCRSRAVDFPTVAPIRENAAVDKPAAAYAVNKAKHPNFFVYADASGRIDRIAYTRDNCPDEIVRLECAPFAHCRHLVIILDGFGYEVVQEYYRQGGLRMFYPPSRVIAPFPTLTDLCMEDIMDHIPCKGFEAKYFDRMTNRMEGGVSDYLSGQNEPYAKLLDYRAPLLWDAVGYVAPWFVFEREINDIKRRFDQSTKLEMLTYSVSSAGISTAFGADGQRRVLQRVDQMIYQIAMESHGLTKFTIMADHGHSYTHSKRAPLEDCLKSKGWNFSDSLKKDRDVALVEFGLVTFASLSSNQPAKLAADVLSCPGVVLASYAAEESVVVLSCDGGKAIIRRNGNRYSYQICSGDPLQLKPILARLKADKQGFYSEEDLFEATYQHVWPNPLERLWRAHFVLVNNPPDVIVSLADDYYAGMKTFGAAVDVASTHGSLNRRNSTTFIMSTAGPLPKAMRSRDISRHMTDLVGRPWPQGR